MDAARRTAAIGIVVALVVGGLVGWAGSDGSVRLGDDGLPVFALCAILAFGINIVVFVPSYLAKTEHYFDLTGSITYITVTAVALALSPDLDARAWLAAVLVWIWAARLGSFLFRRIKADGKDGRFDAIKVDVLRFGMTWILQGLWVTFTAAAAWAIITAAEREPLGVLGAVGVAVWIVGFGFEAVADRQKSAFKADPANAGRFITTGLWAWSRHPNYFGEITLWTGMAIMALPILSGWRWVALISPVFVTLLLTRISGLPMLERRGLKRWGDDPEYQAYLASVPVLVPRPPR